jgi:hypothetical protein
LYRFSSLEHARWLDGRRSMGAASALTLPRGRRGRLPAAARPAVWLPSQALGCLRAAFVLRAGLFLRGVLGAVFLAILRLVLAHRFRARLEHSADARTGSRRIRHGAGAAFGPEDFRRGVVGDVVAADLVLTALQECAIEELDQVLRAIVLDALCVSFVVLVAAVALLPDLDRVAVGGRRQRIVGVLLEHDAIRANRQRALRDDDVARESAAAGLQIGVARISRERDRLVAVALRRRRRQCDERSRSRDRGQAVHAARCRTIRIAGEDFTSLACSVGGFRARGLELDRARVVVEHHPDAGDYSTRLLDRHEGVGLGKLLLRNHAQRIGRERCGADRSFARLGCRRGVAVRADVAAQRDGLAVARHRSLARRDCEARLAGLGELEHGGHEIHASVVGKVLGAACREHLPHAAAGVERHRAEALDEEVGIVTRRSVVAASRRNHLRVEPIRERREPSQKQHGRPGDQPIEEPRALRRHRGRRRLTSGPRG